MRARAVSVRATALLAAAGLAVISASYGAPPSYGKSFDGEDPLLVRPIPGRSDTVLPIFRKPFDGEYHAANVFDHQLPFWLRDDNGYMLTWWGTRIRGIDGHDGYDWSLPEGTPLLAVAAGEVINAGESRPFSCPLLQDREVTGLYVSLRHLTALDDGPLELRTLYLHMSRVDVREGQWVEQGQLIGVSGNTGCSTGPHLHFEVSRSAPGRRGFTVIDPFGWDGPEPDPWVEDPRGALSLWLWQENQAPAIFRETRRPLQTAQGARGPLTITAVRWMGWRDEQNLNNEFVELELDASAAGSSLANLGGFRLRASTGETFTFPTGFIIRRDGPVRVYTGAGTATETALFWGLSSPLWDDFTGQVCVSLLNAQGRTLSELRNRRTC